MTAIVYRPEFAPHVVGEIEPSRGSDELRVSIRCEKCHATFRTACPSGHPRTHVKKFAVQHLHRDVLLDPFPTPKDGAS